MTHLRSVPTADLTDESGEPLPDDPVVALADQRVADAVREAFRDGVTYGVASVLAAGETNHPVQILGYRFRARIDWLDGPHPALRAMLSRILDGGVAGVRLRR